MQTKILKEQNGVKFISGISREYLDPEETRKKIKPFVTKTKQFLALDGRRKTLSRLSVTERKIIKDRRDVVKTVQKRLGDIPASEVEEKLTAKEKAVIGNFNAQLLNTQSEMTNVYQEIESLLPAFTKEYNKIMFEKGVYSELKNDEEKITDAEADELKKLFESYPKKKFWILTDLTPVRKMMKRRVFKKVGDNWEMMTAETIQDCIKIQTEGWKTIVDLVEFRDDILKSIESNRIASLPMEDKEKELGIVLDDLAQQAANMEAKNQFKDEKTDVKKWYNEQKKILVKKYK